jgi:hypothetical protein
MSSNRTPGSRVPLGADLVIPLLALAFAGYFFVSISGLAWEAKANGVLIGSVLALLVAAQLVRIGLQVWAGAGSLRFDPLLLPRDALVKRIGMVVLTAVFIVSMDWLGLTLALFLATAAALYLMGVRKRTHLLWTPLGVSAFAYVTFIVVLDSEFPRGPVETLLARIF